MAVYVYIGHDEQANVIALYPQPARVESLHHADIHHAPGGLSYPRGYLMTRLRWNVSERLAFPLIKSYFGLDLTTTSSEITIALDDDDGNLSYFNAVANYEEDIRRAMNFNRDLEIAIVKMESIAAP